ncbi:MAG: DNA replication/repair protein RecF [Clostridia bacterium]|nr:DNA replication/repair protein RecF [Clostridia bacterium]
MRIKSFRATNFRNIVECDISFTDGVNFLFGENAQGKTNAIEGIYLFSRGRSFRSVDDREMIRFGEEGFRISITYVDRDGEGVLEYACFGRERLRKRNGYKISRVSEMIGSFKSVLFYPDDLDLVKGGPEERRGFLNVAISQCYPEYLSEYSRFKIALENRNSLLKSASKGGYIDEGELLAWSEQMADYASYIYLLRRDYLNRLSIHAGRVALDMSGGRECVTMSLKSDILECGEKPLTRDEVRKKYIEVFTSNIQKEKIVGTSLYGPQRDDIEILLNEKSARAFASQGQQRSIVLAMKLSEGEVIKELFSEYPVFLFDDVLSELDESRRRYCLSGMGDRQVIITSCESERLKGEAGNVIEVKEGEYVFTHR